MAASFQKTDYFKDQTAFRILRKLSAGVLGLFFVLTASAQTMVVDYGDYWKFNIPNSDPGTSWRGLNFNDGVALNGVSWGSGYGLLGFETAPLPPPGLRTPAGVMSSAPMVYLFRKTFTYSGSTNGATFSISQIVDDGVTYYLNGTLLGSVRHAPGAWNNAASGSVGEAVEEINVLSGPANGLVNGTNVLTAEVHQVAAFGSDMVFGARLMINTGSQTLSNWRVANFSTSNNSGNAADTADPDGDKLPNIVEYALCQDPNLAQTEWGTSRIEGANLVLTYRRRTAAFNELSFATLWATDMKGPWSSGGVSEQIVGEDGTSQWIKAQMPSAGAAKLFFKVQVGSLLPPNVPTNFTVTANSETQMTLNWTDNSSNTTGFDILRSVNGGAFVFLTSVAGDARTYRDAGLTANTTYSYQIRSKNGAGASAYTAASPATPTWSTPYSVESFEGGVPSYVTASRPESLSTSGLHYKHGTKSLRWQWAQGEELILRHGIGNVARTGGFLNKASFVVYLYSEDATPGSLTFEFREGNNVTGSFEFPLGFTGWRQARLHYDGFHSGAPSSNVDNIRVLSPAGVASGAVYFDAIWYNALSYPSAAIDPVAVANLPSVIPDYQQFPKPATVTQAELSAIQMLAPPTTPGSGVSEAVVTDVCNRVNAVGIVKDANGVRGPGLDKGGNYYQSIGDWGYTTNRSWGDELGPDGPVVQLATTVSPLVSEVANTYRSSNNADQRTRLSQAFLLLAEHFHDQEQPITQDSFTKMREVLAQTGKFDALLTPIIRALKTGSGFFVSEDVPVISNMDFYSGFVHKHRDICLLQVEPAEQVRWMNFWKANVERSVLQPTGAFKVDGSAYHHSGHYHSYAQPAFANFPLLVLQKMRNTPWQLSPEVHERIRRSMLAQRFYANLYDIPISLRGRSPFTSGYGLILSYGVNAFLTMAQLGTPDGSQSVDREVAAAHIRLDPAAATNSTYQGQGITAEPHPNGTFSMPYAGLLTHRRSDWMAAVKGQSKYVWGSERQDRRNCYGLFMALGALEIFAGGSPISAVGSGCDAAGWDWGRFEGTTVPHLPLAKLDAGWTSVSTTTKSAESFLGGLSHKGSQGVFGMVVDQMIWPDSRIIRAKKSWFFSDDRILCLGSDISCTEGQYPTETILCQKALRPGGVGEIPPTTVDGASMTSFPITQPLSSSQAHWFIDVQQTGYYVPAGQNVTISRVNQTSRDLNDLVDTTGDFLTAWINHGYAPTAGGYEYMIMVRATSQAMANVVANPPFQVLERSNIAHVVWDTIAQRWNCVLFTPQILGTYMVGAQTLPIKMVDRPCMVMADIVQNGRLDISVADPDLNLVNGSSIPRPLRVTVRGAWSLSSAAGKAGAWSLPNVAQKVRIISSNATETVVEIDCEHGASYDISLIP